jgi:integrase
MLTWLGRRSRPASGGEPVYSDAAVRTCLTMKVLFGMALRQTTGFVESLLCLIGLDRDVPGPERVPFPGYRGKHLSARQISQLFKETLRKSGITKPVTLHALRHSFATHLLERGVDIRVIQALLGHAKLTTTACYASVATGMIAAVDSPLDDLNETKRKKNRPKPS